MDISFEISGNIIDVIAREIYQGTVCVKGSGISSIRREPVVSKNYILPGLVDSHIHIESSMLIPSEFARLAVVHGTVATVSDPHEIANVLGIPGIRFMIQNGKKVPFKFSFGAPSCVPATTFETAGATLGPAEVEELLSMEEIRYLSEMMNFPGVLHSDPDVMAKLHAARKMNKPVDGHAPGLRGKDAATYINAGISTDHECFTLDEALDKLGCGMKILIREGSAARNYEALCSLIDLYPEKVMLCSDDKHPDDLVKGHINELVKRSIQKGYDLFNILRSCTLNPVRHYNLPVGLLQPGDPADFIVADTLTGFNILATYVNGIKVAENGRSLITRAVEQPANSFHAQPVDPRVFAVRSAGDFLRVMKAVDGQLMTFEMKEKPSILNGFVVQDPERDILKLVVKNRYGETPPAVGFVNGFGLKHGAIASCVAHDSHNIVAVGTDDESITKAINLVVTHSGGISLTGTSGTMVLPLPFAGIMSTSDGYEVAASYSAMDQKAKEMGSRLRAPFMTLSFMALLVIPEVKLSDRGLFDGRKFEFLSNFF